MQYGMPIAADDAKRVAASALAEAREKGWLITIAIVDTSGNLVYFEKMDDALLGAIDTAIAKARSAVRFKQSTKGFQESLEKGGAQLRVLSFGVMPVDGGEPLVIDGKLVGAIGVSGVTAAQDGQVAVAAAKTLTSPR